MRIYVLMAYDGVIIRSNDSTHQRRKPIFEKWSQSYGPASLASESDSFCSMALHLVCVVFPYHIQFPFSVRAYASQPYGVVSGLFPPPPFFPAPTSPPSLPPPPFFPAPTSPPS
jgi:hypothetical protein